MKVFVWLFTSHKIRLIFLAALLCFGLLVGLGKTSPANASGRTFYVSPTGSDTASGSLTSPFRTFSKVNSMVSSGDTIKLLDGTYKEQLIVTASGTPNMPITVTTYAQNANIDARGLSRQAIYIAGNYVNVSSIKILGSDTTGVDLKGSFLNVNNMSVQNTVSHGVSIRGTNINVSNSSIFHNVQENSGNQGHWGSGIKVNYLANNIKIQKNKVYENWGEGIAATRASNVEISGNEVYDNFSVNIYIDNSYSILADGNFVYCHPNSGYERDGLRARGISISEEYYSGWGSRLNDLKIVNNIVAHCYRGINFYSAEVSNAGLRNSTIAFNTLYGSTSYGLYINDFPETSGSVVINNLVAQQNGNLYYIPDKSGLTMSNNFWVNGSTVIGVNDKLGEPKFVQLPSYNWESFKLELTSPAIDAGKTLSDITQDFAGMVRTQNMAPDIGALESGGVTVPKSGRIPCFFLSADDSWACLVKPVEESEVSEPNLNSKSKLGESQITKTKIKKAKILNLVVMPKTKPASFSTPVKSGIARQSRLDSRAVWGRAISNLCNFQNLFGKYCK